MKIRTKTEWNFASNSTHHIDYTPDYDRDCEQYNCDFICRCAKLVDVDIESISYSSMYCAVVGKRSVNSIKEYVLDRCIRKIISINDFMWEGVPGYYGDETNIYLDDAIYTKLCSIIKKIQKSSISKAIELYLELEYGYVLPEVMDQEWHIQESVPIKNINLEHKDNISESIVAEYSSIYNKDMIMLLTKKSNNFFRIIDGRHRYTALVNNKKRTVRVIYCK